MIRCRERPRLDRRFIRHLEFERRLSPQTCKNYRRDLLVLREFRDYSGIDSWDDMDSEHFRAFSASSFRKGLSARSIQRRLSACRTFYRYLLREKHVKSNPTVMYQHPKARNDCPATWMPTGWRICSIFRAKARSSTATAPYSNCCIRRDYACPSSPDSTATISTARTPRSTSPARAIRTALSRSAAKRSQRSQVA